MRVPVGPGLLACAALALGACTPAPPPAKDYAYPTWGFKAAFASPPKETAQPGAADGSKPDADLVEANAGGRDFAVWAADVSKTQMSLEDLAKSSSEHVAQGLSAAPSIQTYAATSEGVMGREFTFTKDGKWAATMRVFLANGRFYEVIGKTLYGENDPALKDFLFSFHTLGPPPAANAAW